MTAETPTLRADAAHDPGTHADTAMPTPLVGMLLFIAS
jgi:hypothetical protein